jgi:hypothetical protein
MHWLCQFDEDQYETVVVSVVQPLQNATLAGAVDVFAVRLFNFNSIVDDGQPDLRHASKVFTMAAFAV